MQASPVDAMYRDAGVDFQLDSPERSGPPVGTLADMVDRAARMPLIAQPGTAWNYSIATDILAHLIAVMSGQSYIDFMQTRLFGPLGMNDTSFRVRDEKLGRFAAHYTPAVGGVKLLESPHSSPFVKQNSFVSGGGGAVSTGYDYLNFCQMLLNGGIFNGARILGRKTVELMTSNHLTGGDVASWGTPRLDQERYEGTGFGLGLSVLLSAPAAQILGSAGQVGWWGSASTSFWLDPQEDMAVVFLAQLTPSAIYPLRRVLRVLVYQALT